MNAGIRISVAAIIATALMLTVEAGAQSIAPADYPGPLLSVGPVLRAREPADVYIVQFSEPGAASYQGGVPGIVATKAARGERFDASKPGVESYVSHLETGQNAALASIGVAEKLYSFSYAFNGVAVALTPDEVTRLARHPDVIGIWPDRDHRLETNNSSLFLGLLDQTGGLRADLRLTGENVIVGVIDSGVDPAHPALQDYEEQIPRTCRSSWAESSWLGFLLCFSLWRDPPTVEVYEPPVGFMGTCQEGEAFAASACNNKLIGARYFNDGFLMRHELHEGEYASAKDADGHGTHIATIIAGNPVTASLFGTRVDEISGIAPRARVAVYKACWLTPDDPRATCTTSDLARAIDAAVADGVDILNYSIGSLETDLTAPEDIALLNAVDAGVLSVVAAGNDGPANFTLGSPGSAPWVLTVGASTQSGTRYEQAIEVTAPDSRTGLLPMREASFTPQLSGLSEVEAPLVLFDDGQDVLSGNAIGSFYDACEAPINAATLNGAIALIERGGCTFEAKILRAEDAGAVGVVVYARSGEPIVMNGTDGSVGIPAVMIGAADGNMLVDSWLADEAPSVRLAWGLLADIRENGNQMAAFSSRGPALSESDFIKPDLTAPGVNILAGSSPDIASGISGEFYQYLSGTSMSAPMVAGIAALIREARPDWSPAVLKSSLMTTAYDDVVTEDSSFRANAFDMGSGHVDANEALDPGLVFEAGFADYRAWLCSTETEIVPAAECASLAAAGYPGSAESLNLPSIGITELIPNDEVARFVTNIGPAAVYEATVSAPPGMSVTVDPVSLSLGEGETASFRLNFSIDDAPYQFWQFGSIHWSDGVRDVSVPIAAQPVYLRAPRDIELPALSGAAELPVDFGYSGGYTIGVNGLHPPGLREPGVVADDPTNNFSFRFDSGVNAHYFTLGAGELFLRVSLFDELTDGNDDLDLYLYHCPTLSSCVEVGDSGSFTSEEEIDLLLPEAGLYAAMVHGFQTDQTSGGPGANYEILAWSFGPGDDLGNLRITAPDSAESGDRLRFPYEWGPLDPDTIYLGAIGHNTPFDVFFLSIVTANTP